MARAVEALFLTWTTYGNWLPGDDRGWTDHRRSDAPSQREERAERLAKWSAIRMNEREYTVSGRARLIVDRAIREHIEHKGWRLLALNVRTNHVHVVLQANRRGSLVMTELKAWSTRALRAADSAGSDQRVWTRHGSTRQIVGEEPLRRAIEYVTNEQ